jgi:hypothetical protein
MLTPLLRIGAERQGGVPMPEDGWKQERTENENKGDDEDDCSG